MKKLFVIAAIAAIAPFAAQAESTFVADTIPTAGASAHLDFTITVPKVLSLQIGNNASVNNLSFGVLSNNVGTGSPIQATGGDLPSPNAVTVRVFGNIGDLNLNSSVKGPLSNGSGGSVSWDQITVGFGPLTTGTTGFNNTGVLHPAFNSAAAGGLGTPISLKATGGVVRQEGSWTFSYNNAAPVPAGTYGGAGDTNNGRVTYTAAIP